MTSTRLHPGKTIFDGWRSISISLFVTRVGFGVLVGDQRGVSRLNWFQ